MGSLLLELIPFAAGLAITPAAIASCILFLSSRRPAANAVAFAAAFALVYVLIAAAILAASQSASGEIVPEQTKAALTLVVGIVLLSLAAAGVLHGQAGPATRAPGWMRGIDTAGPRVAFGLGLALAVLNPNIPILIAALATIAAAEVSEGQEIIASAVLVAASQLGLAGPIAWFVTHRRSATSGLAAVKAWLGRHEHVVNLAVLLVFGALFTVNGLSGL